MSNNVLNKTKCYLMGAMENADGQPWRNTIKESLKSTGITFFDPYHKPFINIIKEDEAARKSLKEDMANGNYDSVAERMKQVRSDDLRLCDLSDFGIVQINPNIATWGTVEEMVWFTRCKKPLFVFIEGSKHKTPLWVMGMIPHKYIYNDVNEVIEMISKIDRGEKVLDSDRWRLLRTEYR